MRRETKDGLSRQLIESRIPDAVDVIRRYVAATPLNTPLPGLPAMMHLAGETTSQIVAQSSTQEYRDDVRLVLKAAVTRGFLHAPRLPKTPSTPKALRWSTGSRRCGRVGGRTGVTAPAAGHPLPGRRGGVSHQPAQQHPPAAGTTGTRDGHGRDLPAVTKDAKARRDSSCARAMSKCLVTSSSGSLAGRAVRGRPGVPPRRSALSGRAKRNRGVEPGRCAAGVGVYTRFGPPVAQPSNSRIMPIPSRNLDGRPNPGASAATAVAASWPGSGTGRVGERGPSRRSRPPWGSEDLVVVRDSGRPKRS